MGIQELIASLENEAEEKVRLIKEDAKRRAGAIEEEKARRLGELSAEAERDIAARSWALSMERDAMASEEARAVMLKAQTVLAERLRASAAGSLKILRRDNDYAKVFRLMASELPNMRWEQAIVNSADEALAKEAFPSASITLDEAISGGMEVFTDGGAVCIVNTFESRLQLAWDSILPEMIKEVADGLKGNS